jgi:hypothetical protein
MERVPEGRRRVLHALKARNRPLITGPAGLNPRLYTVLISPLVDLAYIPC